MKWSKELRAKKAHNRGIAKANKLHRTEFKLFYHNEHDADVIAKLKSVGNRTNYVRQLIKADIAKGE